MTERIAGHDFDPITNRCVGLRHDGVHWLSVRPVTQDDVGREGIAHTAQLTGTELAQIVARRDREDAAYDAATREASGA